MLSITVSADVESDRYAWIAGSNSTISHIRKIDSGSVGEVYAVSFPAVLTNAVKLSGRENSTAVHVLFLFAASACANLSGSLHER